MTTFRDLHAPGKPFILVNVWDVGSAQAVAGLGAQALGTSSAAHAFTIGKRDMGYVTRDESLAHAADIVSATDLPVSGDFENGYGEAPDYVAETIRLAQEAGLAGCSIEDTDMPGAGAYDFDLAVERIKAASAAARALPKDFVLVARADGVMNRSYDMAEALRRIRAFDEAGADCLYVPLPPDMDGVKEVVAATKKPVNALAAGPFTKVPYDEYAAAGVARVSLGSALASTAHRAFIDAAEAMLTGGDFSQMRGVSGKKLGELMKNGAKKTGDV